MIKKKELTADKLHPFFFLLRFNLPKISHLRLIIFILKIKNTFIGIKRSKDTNDIYFKV